MEEQRSGVRVRQLVVAIGAGVLMYTALAVLGGFSGWSGNSASAAYEYQYPGELKVIKHVINDDGGTATAAQWSIHVKSGGSDVAGSPQPGSEVGTTYVLPAGTYVVSESGGPAGYVLSFEGDCNSDGVVSVSQLRRSTCTLVNDDQPRCDGQLATIYVNDQGRVVGGPNNGQVYTGKLNGTPGPDVMVGTDGPDEIAARGGNDTVCGRGGNDEIEGGPGHDRLFGEGGNDELQGGRGNDTMTGGPGADKFSGGAGTDAATDFNAAEGDTKTGVEIF